MRGALLFIIQFTTKKQDTARSKPMRTYGRCNGTTKHGDRCPHTGNLVNGRCDYHQERELCVGTKQDGTRCRINTHLNLAGYCEHHDRQNQRCARQSPWMEPCFYEQNACLAHPEDQPLTSDVNGPVAATVAECMRIYDHTTATARLQEAVLTGAIDPCDLNGFGWSLLHASLAWGLDDLAQWLIHEHLVPVDIVDSRGETPLQAYCRSRYPVTARALAFINRLPGAYRTELSSLSYVLRLATQSYPRQDRVNVLLREVDTIHTLVATGNTWDATCDDLVDQCEATVLRDALEAMRGAVEWWTRAKANGGDLLRLAADEFRLGRASMEQHLKALDDAVNLHVYAKICVLGAPKAGKTSFTKSMYYRAPHCESSPHGTVGIDLFPVTFEDKHKHAENDRRRYHVWFWDLAGQDVYHAAHAVFLSEQSLYVLCIDLHEYAALASDCEKQRFLQHKVVTWVNLARQSNRDAKILVVYTKANTVDTKHAINDMETNLIKWNELQGFDRQNMITMDNSDGDSVCAAVDKLKAFVRDNTTVVDDEPDELIQFLQKCRNDADGELMHVRLRQLVVPVHTLCTRSAYGAHATNVSRVEYFKKALRAVADVAGVTWFDSEHARGLRDYVVLDVQLVLALVKGVINHTLLDNSTKQGEEDERVDALRREGLLAHSLLVEKSEIWRDLDECETSAAARQAGEDADRAHHRLAEGFKSLLKYWGLALAANGDAVMNWDSDLIVPALWGTQGDESQATSLSTATPSDADQRIVWTYEVDERLCVSETLFTQFAVISRSELLHRWMSKKLLLCTTQDGAMGVVQLITRETSATTLIKLTVCARVSELAEALLMYLVMKMELVIDKEFDVGRRLTIGATKEMPVGEPDPRNALSGVLRPTAPHGFELDWFHNKVWEMPGAAVDRLERARSLYLLRHLESLVQKKDRLPGFFSLEWDEKTEVLELRVYCELTLRCYHTPIEIKLKNRLDKWADVIKGGLHVFNTIGLPLATYGLTVAMGGTSVIIVPLVSTASSIAKEYVDKQQKNAALAGRIQRVEDLPSERRSRELLCDLLEAHTECPLKEIDIGGLTSLKSCT